jgi:hypothetical protein
MDRCLRKFFWDRGFRLGLDEPYSGSIVPMKHYQKYRQVKSIMLEVNRKLYLNADYSGGPRFDEIQVVISEFLKSIKLSIFEESICSKAVR